ncbi:MAG: HypC/HybG/HupF family hydrogenase formation chaperone [Spirochaetes bacterium]|nr:HypC/HybG/HupF family hydrogenase formation chaperone [Spirochaetota bacterium]
MTVLRIEGNKAIVESHGVETLVDISLYPDLQVNDKVIVHAGFAIEKINEEEAQKTLKLYNDLATPS